MARLMILHLRRQASGAVYSNILALFLLATLLGVEAMLQPGVSMQFVMSLADIWGINDSLKDCLQLRELGALASVA